MRQILLVAALTLLLGGQAQAQEPRTWSVRTAEPEAATPGFIPVYDLAPETVFIPLSAAWSHTVFIPPHRVGPHAPFVRLQSLLPSFLPELLSSAAHPMFR